MLQLLFPSVSILVTYLGPSKLGLFPRVQAGRQKTVSKGARKEPVRHGPEEPWHQRSQNSKTSSAQRGGSEEGGGAHLQGSQATAAVQDAGQAGPAGDISPLDLGLELNLQTQRRQLTWAKQSFILGAGLLGGPPGQSLGQSTRWVPIISISKVLIKSLLVIYMI